MKYTHLFWDFDGTLYNSYPQIIAALQRTMAEAGLPIPSPEEALPLLKHSVYHTVKHYADRYNKEVQPLLAAFRCQHALETEFPPYNGLGNCLTKLADAGCRHYLYTHRDRLAIRLLERDGLWSLFTGAVTADDGFPHKPAPDALLYLLKHHSLDAAQCVMIGDRGIDIESGVNAGIAGAVFDPESLYFGPDVPILAKSMAELAERLLDA